MIMKQLLNNIFIKYKKLLITSGVVIVLASALIIFNLNITKVSAQIIPVTVSTNNLSFGTVFPGEEIQGNFIVTYVEDEGGGIAYKLIQKRKPLPPEHPEYPEGGDPEMPGYYRDLCPHLEKVSLEEENDVPSSAFVGPTSTDPSDNWTIYFKVPAIFGHVGQDHTGGVVDESGEYGCDISIDIEGWVLFDSFTVPATIGTPTESNEELEEGIDYKIEVVGTYYFRAEGNSSGYLADAEWANRNDAYGTGWTKGDSAPYSAPYNGLDLCFDTGTNTNWGGLDEANHTYSVNYTGTGSKINLFIKDSDYSDNFGQLTVNIYSWE